MTSVDLSIEHHRHFSSLLLNRLAILTLLIPKAGYKRQSWGFGRVFVKIQSNFRCAAK